MVKLLNIDCLEYMKTLPDKSFDLAVVDPPYNIVSQQKRGIGSRIDASGKMNDWNHAKPAPEYYSELFRVSEHAIIWGANNFELPPSEYFIVWDKQQTVDNFASAEYAWTNYKQPAKVFRYSIHRTMQERKKEGGKIHPTQKPIALYNWIFENYAKKGQRILDTHLGSGSSAISAFYHELEFVGCEIDREYYVKAQRRFSEATRQVSMFMAASPHNKHLQRDQNRAEQISLLS